MPKASDPTSAVTLKGGLERPAVIQVPSLASRASELEDILQEYAWEIGSEEMSLKHASWGVCARTDAAHLERLAKRDLRCRWSVSAGNDGYAALFVHRGEPSFRIAQRLAAELGAPVVVLNFDDDLYTADLIRDDGSERRLVESPPDVLAAHGIAVPGDEPRVIHYAALAIGVDRAALEAVDWDSDYEARVLERGVLVTGGIGTLGLSSSDWSRKLKCEVFVANWAPATRVFVCLHLAPGVDERLRWVDGYVDGAVAGATEPAGVLRAAGIPAAALGMDEGAP